MRRTLSLPARLLAVAVPLLATVANADPVEGGGWHHGMHGWGGWVFGPIMMLLFFALLVGAVFVIARLIGSGSADSGGNGDRNAGNGDRAIDILRERLARGEITRAEFEETRKALE